MLKRFCVRYHEEYLNTFLKKLKSVLGEQTVKNKLLTEQNLYYRTFHKQIGMIFEIFL
ncbi:Protein CBG25291 [Caenorhabditis briggsae]|uniref:Protein CBG25291 n=1 Tax=Caenorhabditis briggsae TaxID=6238 RepID=B6IIG1_CAEBR|nr:Protein CBG25291 [Caenorhabditis briggsae]CAR99691.1 Protein CBG25291 [Caenorhabditis briggsae]